MNFLDLSEIEWKINSKGTCQNETQDDDGGACEREWEGNLKIYMRKAAGEVKRQKQIFAKKKQEIRNPSFLKCAIEIEFRTKFRE